MRRTSTGRGRPTTRRLTGQRVRGAISSLVLLLAFGALALGGYQTASGRWHATPVLSGSMRPGLQPGDVVITQRVPVSELHVRDVIVFHPPNEAGQQLVHRIVRLKVKDGTTVITTRGDANTADDPAATALRGTSAYRVVRVVPLLGYPAVWLSGGHHGLLAIGLGVLLLVVAAVVVLRPETPRKEPSRGEPADAPDSAGAGNTVPTPAVPEEPEPSSSSELVGVSGDRRADAAGGSHRQDEYQHLP